MYILLTEDVAMLLISVSSAGIGLCDSTTHSNYYNGEQDTYMNVLVPSLYHCITFQYFQVGLPTAPTPLLVAAF